MKALSYLPLIVATILPLTATADTLESQTQIEMLNTLPTHTSMSDIYTVGDKESRRCRWCRR